MKKLLGVSLFIFVFFTLSLARAHAATLYWYNSGDDAQWTTLEGNWWTNADHADGHEAGALPTANDSVVTVGTVGPEVNLDSEGLVLPAFPATINARATGITFTSAETRDFTGTITGSTTFNGSSYNAGTITGTTTLNGTGYNSGTITGTTTLNSTSYNVGTINGPAKFNTT